MSFDLITDHIHKLAAPFKLPHALPSDSAGSKQGIDNAAEDAARFESVAQSLLERLDILFLAFPSLLDGLNIADQPSNPWNRFVCASAVLLSKLKDAMMKMENESVRNGDIVDVLFKLSLQMQKSIRIVVELVVCWGILPNMGPGMGRPVAHRHQRLKDIMKLQPTSSSSSPNIHVLWICANGLAEMCDEEELSLTLADSYLVDELAALVELAMSPSPNISTVLSLEQRQRSRQLLDSLGGQRGVPTLNLARGMIYLITSSFQSQKAAKVDLSWLRECFNQNISQLIMGTHRPDGLHSILTIFVENPNTDDAAFYNAAQLITTVPKQVEPDEYFSRLAPRLLEQLRMTGAGAENHSRAAAIIIAVMLQRNADMAFRHVILPMTAPLRPFLALQAANLQHAKARAEEYKRRLQEQYVLPQLDHRTPEMLYITPAQINPAKPKRPLILELLPEVKETLIPEVKASSSSSPGEQKRPATKQKGPADMSTFLASFQVNNVKADALSPSSAKQISQSVDAIYRLVTSNPNPQLMERLGPVIPVLFEMMTSASSGNEKLLEDMLSEDSDHIGDSSSTSFEMQDLKVAQQAKEIILLYLALVPRTVGINTLLFLIFDNDKKWDLLQDRPSPVKLFKFVPKDKELELICSTVEDSDQLFVRDALTESATILDILKSLTAAANTEPEAAKDSPTDGSTKTSNNKEISTPDLLGDLFVQLLVHYVSLNESAALPSSVPSSIQMSERAMVALQVLMGMCESLGENILRNVVQLCLFVQSMLQSEDEEIQTLSMTILDMLTQTGAKVKLDSAEIDVLLVEMLQPLKIISLESDSDAIREFAKRLHARLQEMILSSSTARSQNAPQKEEKLFNPSAAQPVEQPHAASVEEAIADIASPIAPIRAGGLIQLRRFLIMQNRDAIDRLPTILKLFADNLQNSDSYVYFGAIQGLSAVGDVAIQQALPYIHKEYLNSSQKVEIRLKIGESILQIAQRLGDALPKYASEIFNILMPALRDSDPSMRASALSNIAELGEMLKYGLKPFIQEILDVIYDVIMAEREFEVRRAAINVVYQILHGLDQKIFEVIPDHLLRLHDLLLAISKGDADEVTRFLANMAVEELNEIRIERIQKAAEARPNFLGGDGFESKLRIL